MPRPTKLTPERHDLIVKALTAGNTRKASAEYAGVDYASLLNWVQRGEAEGSGIYFQFFHAVRKAESDAEVRNVAIIQKAAASTWQAAAWWLERRRHQDWKTVERVEQTGADGGPVQQELTITVVYEEPPRETD